MSTQVTTRASKQHPRAAAKRLKSPKEEQEEEEVADRPRKGRACRRRKAATAPASSKPEALAKAKRSCRTSVRRGRGEAGSPCSFQMHRHGGCGSAPSCQGD